MASLRGKAGAQPAYGAMLAGGRRTGARNEDQRQWPRVLVIKPWPRRRDVATAPSSRPATRLVMALASARYLLLVK
jgi:hypothetical protein